jgi:hypothetical protein
MSATVTWIRTAVGLYPVVRNPIAIATAARVAAAAIHLSCSRSSPPARLNLSSSDPTEGIALTKTMPIATQRMGLRTFSAPVIPNGFSANDEFSIGPG